ncbi:MAG TPA: DUF4157 domain-containing protein, partial [Blastocatellia bacterium]|nr:DUF4157 domain-containing protein [Blastocatellia bacterium]
AGMIVEDTATDLQAGQMKKGEFLAELRTEVCRTAEAAMADNGRTTDDCPYLDFWFNYYSEKDSQHIERAIRKYAPETSRVTAAREYISMITVRVRRSVEVWARTGEMTGVPEGLLADSPFSNGTCNGQGTVSPPKSVLKKAREGAASESHAPRVIQGRLGSGRPLEGGVRSQLESAYGEDFSRVRVHTDAGAASVSASLNARAFTVGEDIAFGADEYKPGTLIGDALIAHEMAHVLQQRGGGVAVESKLDVGAGYSSLEEDADQAAVGAVASIWGMTKSRRAHISRNAMPRLKSGLRLQGCKSKSKGPIGPQRLMDARSKFQSNNDHLTAAELQKIDEALKAVTADNLNLWIAFYDHYTNHDIEKVPVGTGLKKGHYGDTNSRGNTDIRSDLLDPNVPNTKLLGTTLIHEFSHTAHGLQYGEGDYLEGESYAVEHFLAVRVGDKARADEIEDVLINMATSMGQLAPALKRKFRITYAAMQGLYEIVDKGSSSHSGSPFVTPSPLTADEARALVAELVSDEESDRSRRLQDILKWVESHPSGFNVPTI